MVGKLTSNQIATNCCNSTSADPDVSPDYAGAVLMIGLAVAIIASNSLILVAILTYRKLRNNYDYLFVFSLSLCDVLVGLLNVPYEATVYILWYPSPLTCATLRAIQVTLKTANLFIVALITLNKYIKIFYPFRYPFLVTGKTVCATLTFAWAFPVAWAAYAVQKLARAESVRVDMQCFQEKPPKQLAIVFFTMKFLLPALFLLIGTTRIALLVRDQHRRIASLNVSATGQASEPSSGSMTSQQHLTKKELHAVRLAASIAATFLLFWCPINIISLLTTLLCKRCGGQISITITANVLRLSHLNSAINPILYSLNKPLRAACKQILKRQTGPLIVQE
ncbi:D(1)-like dopamine receptor [Ptychodera flava]|uniref:D(1)-like dopamine receptor n=1 Tax=Ptychodera flava TaxID=63121 RepID=UPI003969C2D9